MKKMNLFTALPLLLLLVMAFAPGGFAQDQQTPHQKDSQQMSQDQSISGQLKSVDTDAKKITVTTTDGSDMEFVYNDQTRCTGSQDSIQGLSTSSGSKVTVYYRDENQQKLATRIDVQAAPKAGDSQVSPHPDKDTPPPDMQRPTPPDPNRPQDNPEQPLPAPPHHQ